MKKVTLTLLSIAIAVVGICIAIPITYTANAGYGWAIYIICSAWLIIQLQVNGMYFIKKALRSRKADKHKSALEYPKTIIF